MQPMIFKQAIRSSIPRWLGKLVKKADQALDPYFHCSYSQEGEDLLLRRIFENQPTGFYVDIGAHHPFRFSNTYLFYLCGWHGLNIDAMPGSMTLFKKHRPRDINLEIGISDKAGSKTYYMFDDPALNGFSKEVSLNIYAAAGRQLIEKRQIETMPLSAVLKQFLPSHQSVDFMTVDTEGLDLEVLSSNDWSLFRPTCILVEAFPYDQAEVIRQFLTKQHYAVIARTLSTLIFQSIPEGEKA